MYPYIYQINLCSNSNRDETTFDPTPAPAALDALNHALSPEKSASSHPAVNLAVNGGVDADIHSSPAPPAVVMPPPDVPADSLPAELSSSSSNDPDSSHFDTDTTPNELPQVSVPEPTRYSDSILDSTIDALVEDSSAPSTFPPVVDSQESDIRDTTPPPPAAQEPAAKTQPETESAGLAVNSNGVSPPLVEATENNSTAALTLAASTLGLSQPSDLQSPTAEPKQQPPSDLEADVVMKSGSPLPTQPVPDASPVDQPDTEMANTSQPPSTKVAREREDDGEDEPSAKRAKTDDEAESQGPASGALATPQIGEAAPAKSDADPITSYQSKEIIKILKNVLRTNDGKNFRAPVTILWPVIADTYNAKISNPIDLGTIETKIREGKYESMGAFKADMQLLADNARTFNGDVHTVTKSGESVRISVLTKTAAIPPEPTAVPKAPKKQVKRSTPVAEAAPRAASARRPSRSAGSGTAPGPSAPTFALDPSTSTPLIRRDSTKNDGGRPKREIHPPKNKDLPYSVRPKGRKYASELRYCEETLNEMKKPKHAAFASAFYVPVDPVALNIPNYFTTIKNPMDLSTITKKLQSGAYQKFKDFESDVQLIFSNCYKFNPPGNPVREMGKQLEAVFNEKWAAKQQWLASHAPSAFSPTSSAAESGDEESEEEEEAENVPQSSAASGLSKRLIEEQRKLITLISAKKPDQALIQLQQEMVAIVQAKVDQENAKASSGSKKKTTKGKGPKAAKKPAAKKAAGGSGKKSGSNNRGKYMGTLEKEVISAGLASLPDTVAESVLTMIKNDKPDVDVSFPHQITNHVLTSMQTAADGTLELDIDVINPATLWKIYGLIQQYAPDVEAEIRKQMVEREAPRTLAKPAQKKKNKPMSKTEQERKIEQLRNSVQEFERHTSGSQEPVIPSKSSPS